MFKRSKRRRSNFWNRYKRAGGTNSFYAEGLRQKYFKKHGKLPRY